MRLFVISGIFFLSVLLFPAMQANSQARGAVSFTIVVAEDNISSEKSDLPITQASVSVHNANKFDGSPVVTPVQLKFSEQINIGPEKDDPGSKDLVDVIQRQLVSEDEGLYSGLSTLSKAGKVIEDEGEYVVVMEFN